MGPRLLLLTGEFEAKLLLPALGRGGTEIVHVETLDTCVAALEAGSATTRLLAFCTAVIVPRSVLGRFPGPCYNIHPGPPCYPGRHPESWGAYDGAARFGATLHEMAPRVDEGAIVDVKWIDVPLGGGQLDYGTLSFRAAFDLVMRWREALLAVATSLPVRTDLAWSGAKRTHAQLEAMCRVDATIEAAELARRQRAFAQVPGSRLIVDLHGRSFVHTVPEAAD